MATILVTGANRGIGLEFVRQYAADGADVIACCRNPAGFATPGKTRVMELDVADPASATRLAKSLDGEPIDILINNAGVFGRERPSISPSYYEEFTRTLQVNCLGALMVSLALRENLVRGRDKKLVVLTSKMGSVADSSTGALAYRASKAALNMTMHVLAREWADLGILVGILHPGWVQTDMGGAGALITPQTSVSGMRERIAELSAKTSGRFLDYNGKEIAW